MSTASDTQSGGEIPSHRACAHCRSQKVRCIPDDDNPDVCQRCARSGRPCVFTPLQKRKQRKRTDTRVAELEREMRAMRAVMKNKDQAIKSGQAGSQGAQTTRPAGLWFEENSISAPRVNAGFPYTQETTEEGTMKVYQQPQQEGDAPTLWPNRFPDRPQTAGKDVIDSGMISMDTATQLFDVYRKDLFPHYPMVVIPETMTAEEMRQSKPTLFLSILAAASGAGNPEISAMLDQEILHAYATKSLVHSEKSLELVQALLISAVWYHPPNKFGQLKYYEYIHMAATMAMDIGIGTRPSAHRSRFTTSREPKRHGLHHLEDAANPDLSMTPRSRDASPDTASIESRRTYLALYIICVGVSMSLRRPNMLRCNSYTRECVEYFERSPAAVPTDRRLVAWTKLIMIAEEISTSFSYDDVGGIALITDLRTQFMLKDFQRRIDEWNASIPEADMNGSLMIIYYTTRLYLHEIALHVDHSPEDFRAPYQMGGLHPWEGDELPTQVLAEAVAECIACAHNLLNTFLSLDVERARGLPVFSYVRISFAAFVLAKLCLSAAHPSSRIGKILDRSSLKVESVMDRAILHVRSIVGPARCRVPAIFLALLFKLRQWCMNPELIERSDGEPESVMKNSVEGSKVQALESTDDESSPQTSADSQADGHEHGASRGVSLPPNFTPQSRSRFLDYSNSPTEMGDSLEDIAPTSMPMGSDGAWNDAPRASSIDAAMAPPPSTRKTASHPTMSLPPSSTMLTTSDSIAIPQQPTPFLAPNDQMELDQNFFHFFGGMNALSQDLTGMEDWNQLPTDLLGLSADQPGFDWPGAYGAQESVNGGGGMAFS